MGSNEKARSYPKQIFDAKKSTKTGSQAIVIEDRLSRVDDSANATYLELVHPASVYRVSILTINDETKKKEVVKANIRLDELALIGIRLKRAEEKLFDMRFDLATPGPSGGESGGIFQTAAFTERFKIAPPSFPDWKNKAPGELLLQAVREGAESVKRTTDGLQNQKNFLVSKLAQYRANQAMIDAIDMAFRFYKEGELNQAEGAPIQQAVPAEIPIYEPNEKTFRSETKEVTDATGKKKELVNSYLLRITFLPQNKKTNYKVYIQNQYVDTLKKDGLEQIVHIGSNDPLAAKADWKEAAYYLTSNEMVEFYETMKNNLEYYKMVIYKQQRAEDERIFYDNRRRAQEKQKG